MRLLRRKALRFALSLALLFPSSAVASAASRKSAAVEREEKIHVVAPGQTLAKIAKRYHVSVADLRAANDLAPGQKIKPGTRLVIPDAGAAREEGTHKAGKTVPAVLREDRDRDEETSDRFRPGPHGNGVAKPGRVHLVRGSESWEGKLYDKRGKLSAKALDAFARILASPGGKRHDIEPRLVSLVGIVSDHFHGRTIEVVSGFRPYTATQYTPHSRHNSGSAIDFHVRGVSNEELRDFCKTLRKVGVGFYPNSSFVHLDVRDESTTWVDYAKPGEPPKYNRADAAKDADETQSEVTESGGQAGEKPSEKSSEGANKSSVDESEATGGRSETTTDDRNVSVQSAIKNLRSFDRASVA